MKIKDESFSSLTNLNILFFLTFFQFVMQIDFNANCTLMYDCVCVCGSVVYHHHHHHHLKSDYNFFKLKIITRINAF